jgi:hypothetical protein
MQNYERASKAMASDPRFAGLSEDQRISFALQRTSSHLKAMTSSQLWLSARETAAMVERISLRCGAMRLLPQPCQAHWFFTR